MIAYRQAPESEYVTPTIGLLREHLETIRKGEIDRARRRLGKLSAEQEKTIELLTHGIINEILNGPITALKAASAEKDPSVAVEIVHRIFDLGGKHKRESRTKTCAECAGHRACASQRESLWPARDSSPCTGPTAVSTRTR
jgi:hypothetical protein